MSHLTSSLTFYSPATTMGIESLHGDVLRIVLSLLNQPDTHRLSWTSRALREATREHVYKDVKLSSSFHQIVAFCEYMLDSADDTLKLLRALQIHAFIQTPETRAQTMRERLQETEEELTRGAALLADFLPRIPFLRILSLHHAEAWMHYEPRIVTSIASMRHIEELELTDIGPHVSDTLRTLQSAPVKLSLAEPALGFQSMPHMWRMDPTGLSLPSVRVLSAKVRSHLPGAPDLARIFPNVREVDFGDGPVPHFLVPIVGAGQAQGERVPVVDWPSLEAVHATGTALKHWKHAHPIHRFELVRPLGKNDGSTFEMAGAGGPNAAWEREDALTAVRNVQPVALVVTLSARLGHRYLRSLLTASRRIRYVSAGVWEVRRYQTWLPDLSQWLNVFGEALDRLKGRGLVCLTIRCSILPEGHPLGEPMDSDPDDAPKSYAEARDSVVDSLRQWASSIPSLRYISLDIGPESRASRAGPSTFGTAMLLASSRAPPPSNRLPGLAVGATQSFWWVIDQQTRACTDIPQAQGERIAQFLCSTRYHWDEDLDMQLSEIVPVRSSRQSETAQ